MTSLRLRFTSISSISAARLRGDLLLLLAAVIWGSAFSAQRVAAPVMGVLTFNGLRFLVGALVLLPFLLRLRGARATRPGRRSLVEVGLAGLLLVGAAGLQHLGLRYTTAANAGFVTGLYVVLVPLLLALFWRRPPRSIIWPAALLAAAGLFLLSTGGRLALNPGDLIELGGAAIWALHIILIDRLVQRVEVLHLAVGQYLVCGAVSLGVGLLFEPPVLPALAQAGWAVLYTGVFSVGLGYTLQAIGQRTAPAADAAILLSLEAAFAALFGWLLLSEGLSLVQLLGCGLMLGGMLLAQVGDLKNETGP